MFIFLSSRVAADEKNILYRLYFIEAFAAISHNSRAPRECDYAKKPSD